MSLSRFLYDPFHDFDRLFDEAFSARAGNGANANNTNAQNQVGHVNTARSMRPRMDVHEDAEKNIVSAIFELPGLKKEDVSIDVHNNLLTISGESKIADDRDENGYAVRERRFGKFSRSIPLPQGVKAEEVIASLENGVLTVQFPKSTPEQAPKKISIN